MITRKSVNDGMVVWAYQIPICAVMTLEAHGVVVDRIVVATAAVQLRPHSLETLLEIEKSSTIDWDDGAVTRRRAVRKSVFVESAPQPELRNEPNLPMRPARRKGTP